MKLSKVLELKNHRFIINDEGDSIHEILDAAGVNGRTRTISSHIMVPNEIMLVKIIIQLMENKNKE